MLNKVEFRNSQGSLLILEFDDVSDGIVLQDIDGLQPVKVSVVSSKFARLKGEQLHALQFPGRNLVFKLGLEPDYVTATVQDLRDRLYAYFMTGEHVSIKLYRSEGLIVDIEGEVEDCSPSIFSREPAMDISIICLAPDFINLTPVTVTGSTVADSTETILTYPGNASTGLVFTLNVDRTITQFTFYLRQPDGTLRVLDVSAPCIAGDVVTISTVPGSKSITRTRAGVVTSILYGVSAQSTWHQLTKGDNNIRIYAVGAPIPYSIQYFERYGGL